MNNATPMTQDELQALAARRDANKSWWELSAEELARAYAAGMRVFNGATLDGATLDGATLDGATLDGATLDGANLLNIPCIYTAYAPHLSSRNDALMGGIVLEGSEIQLGFWAGCQRCVTGDYLRKRVQRTHGASVHAAQYMAAIAFIEACFASDMAAGKWDYLKDWKPAEAAKNDAAEF